MLLISATTHIHHGILTFCTMLGNCTSEQSLNADVRYVFQITANLAK